MTLTDKEKLEAIKKVLDDTPHHFFNRDYHDCIEL